MNEKKSPKCKGKKELPWTDMDDGSTVMVPCVCTDRPDYGRAEAVKIGDKILDRNMFGDDKEYQFAVEYIAHAIRAVVKRAEKRWREIGSSYLCYKCRPDFNNPCDPCRKLKLALDRIRQRGSQR